MDLLLSWPNPVGQREASLGSHNPAPDRAGRARIHVSGPIGATRVPGGRSCENRHNRRLRQPCSAYKEGKVSSDGKESLSITLYRVNPL